ncbi:MAG: hypothetical protein R2697_11910 [Ilumatobacteraceae bacterium]
MNLTIRIGGTVIIMERFDPVEYLRLVEQYQVTHTQLVPTMFSHAQDARSRPDPLRPVLARIAVHAAAPCPVQVKEQMIEW